MQANELADIIRQTGFEVHCYFKNGFLEKVYENALINRLRKKGLNTKQQFPIKVFDEDGSLVGEYVADILVEDSIIIELKASRDLSDVHFAQIIAYLRASRIKHGMVMNFGNPKFQVRKFVL